MKKYFVGVAAMVMGVSVCKGISLAGDGAKALFFGETVTHTVEIKETGDNAAAFSGTEVKTETIETPAAKPAAARKKSAAVVAHTKKEASSQIATGLSYWIEVLGAEGKVERVTADSRVFRTGERIRFAFKSNKEGYLYLLLIGSSGKGAVLFPDVRINAGDNHVASNNVYQVPFGEKTFVMDATPGEEKVLVFFSPSVINDITSYFMPKAKVEPQDARVILACAKASGSKDLTLFEDDAPQDTRAISACGKASGSKDIVYEEDAGGVQPASYIVKKSNDPNVVIFKEITVKHQ